VTAPGARAERSRDLERLLTFIDAIVAVAITLLILPLVDLAGEIHNSDHSVWHLIRTHSGQFWSFAVSFGVIAHLWVSQHRLLRSVIAADGRLTVWLLLWVLAIVFVPFPTSLLPDGGDEAITKVLYMGTLMVCSACLLMLALAIGRNRSVRDSDERPPVAPAAIPTAMLAVALAVSLIFPTTKYYPLLVLLFSDNLAQLVRRRPARRTEPSDRDTGTS
jgi:uncharacterized membrane protein